MDKLKFRIILVPAENYVGKAESEIYIQRYMNKLKLEIELLGWKDVTVNILKVKKSDDEEYPEIEEIIFQVEAGYDHTKKKYLHYQDILTNWKHLFSFSPSPFIILHESNSFIPNRRSCHTSKSCTNVAFGVMPYNGEFHEYTSLGPGACVDFFHDIRNVKIKYSNKEMVFSYNNIRNIFVNINSAPREIFFDLCNPPLIFRVETKRARNYETYTLNHRTMDISHNVDVDTYGRSNIIRVSLVDVEGAEEIISRIQFRCNKKPVLYAHIVSLRQPIPCDVSLELPHFGCTYLLTAIFKRNLTVASQTSNILQSRSDLKILCLENADCLEKALTLVLAALDAGKVINYWHAIENQYRYYISNKDEINYGHYVVPEKCRMIRRVTLTPSRQLLWAPEIMFGNRVLRNFNSEYALRVSFRDDNNSRLSFIAPYSEDGVFDLSIRQPLYRGIGVGSRCYEFLAWSNSQIRDHGIWMYAKDERGKTVRDIRSWMGDFSHIHSVPKYMARMGQCFSQTEDAISVPLDERHIRVENDIEHGYDPLSGKPYCFSDGVGKISSKLAKEVHDALGHDKLCSAFQIRYGGCKGMLVIDPTLNDADIVFRKSMKKFDSPENTRLEIAKTSSPIRLQLNRPFITILNQMGVRHRTFLKLQEEMLKTLTDMLFEEKKAAAFLESKTPSELFGYRDLSHSGIFLTTEPFFRSLLLALHRHHVEKIKSRANIAIDPSRGRNMLGVLDETGILNSGEVFVQYSNDISFGETTRDTKILQRTVLVTKNPCLLAGDVRKFKAVDVPQLHHIVDCIVFPQRGPRPHPNEMAGSDMDGDEYAVLWDDDLIFYRANETPGNFPSAQETSQSYIREADMIEFLITYIKNDQVGAIANAHLAHADVSGIFSSKCISIANKFSYAVDYAKTGVSKHLEINERPTQYPDFMEKNHKEAYKSDNALGKMFRVAQDYASENEHASITYQDIQVDEDLRFPGWEKYREDAIKSRNKYNTLLKTVLRNYGIQHEAEVFSGAFTNLHCRFQERKDRDEIEKVIVRCMKRLTKSLAEEFLEEFKNSSNVKEIDIPVLQKASAWYIVTYSDNDAKFLSFPWTVSKYLAMIKIRKVGNPPLYFSPIVEKMDQQIKVVEHLLPHPAERDISKEYVCVCNPQIVRLALRVLILWAQDEVIIEKPGYNARGLLFTKTFIDIFFHVAELAKYVVRSGKSVPTVKENHFSVASLCIEFFRFCLTLRFYAEKEILDLLTFRVFKYSRLSKRAVVSFHNFAVTSKFKNIYFENVATDDIIQMKEIHIDSKIFPRVPIASDLIEKAENALVKFSQAEWVSLRELRQTKKVVICATGTEQSLKALKSILRKKHVYLRELFTTGELPVEN